jgi:hypothetical protein
MEIHLSLGVSTLVALMAADRGQRDAGQRPDWETEWGLRPADAVRQPGARKPDAEARKGEG